MAKVVRAVAPTSAKPGDKAVLTDAGLLVGWVGGSCAEPIVRRAAETALVDGRCRLVLITPDTRVEAGDDGAGRRVHHMECYSGGELEIYIEPFLALPRLLVFGNSPVARALCDLGALMRYEVTAIDLGDRPQMGPAIDTVRSLKALPRLDPARCFAVVSSHGMFDDESLEAAIALDLPYTGFVASKKRRDQVFAKLRERNISDAALARVQPRRQRTLRAAAMQDHRPEPAVTRPSAVFLAAASRDGWERRTSCSFRFAVCRCSVALPG